MNSSFISVKKRKTSYGSLTLLKLFHKFSETLRRDPENDESSKSIVTKSTTTNQKESDDSLGKSQLCLCIWLLNNQNQTPIVYISAEFLLGLFFFSQKN